MPGIAGLRYSPVKQCFVINSTPETMLIRKPDVSTHWKPEWKHTHKTFLPTLTSMAEMHLEVSFYLLKPNHEEWQIKDSLCSHPHDNRWQDAAQASSLAN